MCNRVVHLNFLLLPTITCILLCHMSTSVSGVLLKKERLVSKLLYCKTKVLLLLYGLDRLSAGSIYLFKNSNQNIEIQNWKNLFIGPRIGLYLFFVEKIVLDYTRPRIHVFLCGNHRLSIS